MHLYIINRTVGAIFDQKGAFSWQEMPAFMYEARSFFIWTQKFHIVGLEEVEPARSYQIKLTIEEA